jgi:hypothetical protein
MIGRRNQNCIERMGIEQLPVIAEPRRARRLQPCFFYTLAKHVADGHDLYFRPVLKQAHDVISPITRSD